MFVQTIRMHLKYSTPCLHTPVRFFCTVCFDLHPQATLKVGYRNCLWIYPMMMFGIIRQELSIIGFTAQLLASHYLGVAKILIFHPRSDEENA